MNKYCQMPKFFIKKQHMSKFKDRQQNTTNANFIMKHHQMLKYIIKHNQMSNAKDHQVHRETP